MITMSHDAILFQGPLPSTAEVGRTLSYKKKQTTHSSARQKSKFPKRLSCGRVAPALTLVFSGQIPSLPGWQNAPFTLPCLPSTTLETLGICSCPKGPWCTAVCLGVLSTTKCIRSRYASAPQLEASGLGFAQGKHVITRWVWIVATETRISSHLRTTAIQRSLIIGLPSDHSLFCRPL